MKSLIYPWSRDITVDSRIILNFHKNESLLMKSADFARIKLKLNKLSWNAPQAERAPFAESAPGKKAMFYT